MSKDRKTAVNNKNSSSLFDKTENWLKKNDRKFFYFLLSLCVFLSFISFNARISEAHDDALYLEGGWRFVHEFPTYFYTQNAPLYPLFLAGLIKLMGFKLMIFKFFSLIFNLLGLTFFYRALRGRIPAIVFIPVMLFQASNHLIIYFASMTFTEAFFFFLQGLFCFYAVKIIDAAQNNAALKSQIKTWLMLGLSMFLLSTCKSSAIVVVPVMMLFFILNKNWKAVGFSLVSYLCFKLPYDLIIKMIWNPANQFKGQSRILLQKDPYNASLGNEDLDGFIARFIENCNLYLSKRFYQLLGFRDENNTEVYGLLTLITIGLCIAGFWLLYKKRNKVMVLLGMYAGAQTMLSFIILQARWDQPRIILINMPILLILMLSAMYYFSIKNGMRQVICLFLTTLMVFSVFISSSKRGFKNLPVVMKNLKGDKYYGYTPDWVNFLKCSEWCADSLDKNSLVASRKAPMSFVYGHGKKFFPVYNVIKKDTATQQSNPDSALAYFKKNHVTHVMVAQLRLDPNNPAAGFINTIHNILGPIARAYPGKLKLVHTEGQYEETEVYEIEY
jgi:hypothetical protein